MSKNENLDIDELTSLRERVMEQSEEIRQLREEHQETRKLLEALKQRSQNERMNTQAVVAKLTDLIVTALAVSRGDPTAALEAQRMITEQLGPFWEEDRPYGKAPRAWSKREASHE